MAWSAKPSAITVAERSITWLGIVAWGIASPWSLRRSRPSYHVAFKVRYEDETRAKEWVKILKFGIR